MSEFIPDALRGLLLHDSRFTDANRISATSQAIPRIGTPIRQASELARLEAFTGAADAAGGTDGSGYADVWIEAEQAGTALPGPGAARILWSPDDPAASTQRGYLPPHVVTGFKWLAYESATLTYHAPHSLALQDGSILTAYIRETSGASTAIYCVRQAPESDPGAAIAISTGDIHLLYSSTYASGPSLIQLPGGRILCYYLVRNNGLARMSASASDDNGATWTRVISEAAGIASSADSLSLRVAYHGGYLTAIIHTTPGCGHYVSANMGAAWTYIEDLTAFGAQPIALPGGGCALLYTPGSPTDLIIAYKSSAFSGFDLDNGVVLAQSTATMVGVDYDSNRAYIAACTAQDGSIYAAFRRSGASPGHRIALIRFNPPPSTGAGTEAYSSDLLWEDGAATSAASWDGEPLYWGDDSERMIGLTLAPFEGGLRLTTAFEGSAGVLTGSLGTVSLGAWSSVTAFPFSFGSYNDVSLYGICYVPFIVASLVAGWTRTGASVSTLTSGGYQQSFAGAAQDYYTATGGTSGKPMVALFTHEQVSGGTKTANDSFVRLKWTDGAVTEHDVRLRFTTTGARLIDLNAGGATLGTDVAGLSAGVAYDWLMYDNGGDLYIWHKLTTETEWTLDYLVTPTSPVTPAANHLFSWGTDSTNSSSARWRFVGVAHYDEVSPLLSEYFGLRGRGLGISPVYTSSGVSVRASRAPVYAGDLWDVPVVYAKGADQIDPLIAPSPRRPWRSTTTVEQKIVWDFGITSRLDSAAIGLSIVRPVGRYFYLEGSPDNAAWTTLVTLDCASGWNALTFSRAGDSLSRNGGAAVTGRVGLDELVDGWALMEDGGTVYLRRINSNTEGLWQATGKQARIRIDDASTAPASGTLHVIRPMATAIAWAVTTTYRYYRLRIGALTLDAGSPAYLGVGSMVAGPLIPFGRQYSRGRTMAVSRSQEVITLPDGSRSVRVTGPARRSVEFQWVDGIDTTDVYAGGSPDYVAAVTSGTALATRNASDLIEGISARQSGASLPVVYLPSLVYDAGGTTIAAQEGQMYGRLLSDTLTRTAALGDELDNEIHTTGVVRLEEEV